MGNSINKVSDSLFYISHPNTTLEQKLQELLAANLNEFNAYKRYFKFSKRIIEDFDLKTDVVAVGFGQDLTIQLKIVTEDNKTILFIKNNMFYEDRFKLNQYQTRYVFDFKQRSATQLSANGTYVVIRTGHINQQI
eukprot:TRINITY_DN16013_c0_g1_i1.p1 TRINITY_DN16013_c0_g1~~TRINITY_DN16013_c0_g1_i1.p1  ORF type:complete len:146 (+),score=33.72 TRINITY_DN16013_c0_g1_i1:32-439(+)